MSPAYILLNNLSGILSYVRKSSQFTKVHFTIHLIKEFKGVNWLTKTNGISFLFQGSHLSLLYMYIHVDPIAILIIKARLEANERSA